MSEEMKKENLALTKALAKSVAVQVGMAVVVHFAAKAIIKAIEK